MRSSTLPWTTTTTWLLQPLQSLAQMALAKPQPRRQSIIPTFGIPCLKIQIPRGAVLCTGISELGEGRKERLLTFPERWWITIANPPLQIVVQFGNCTMLSWASVICFSSLWYGWIRRTDEKLMNFHLLYEVHVVEFERVHFQQAEVH